MSKRQTSKITQEAEAYQAFDITQTPLKQSFATIVEDKRFHSSSEQPTYQPSLSNQQLRDNPTSGVFIEEVPPSPGHPRANGYSESSSNSVALSLLSSIIPNVDPATRKALETVYSFIRPPVVEIPETPCKPTSVSTNNATVPIFNSIDRTSSNQTMPSSSKLIESPVCCESASLQRFNSGITSSISTPVLPTSSDKILSTPSTRLSTGTLVSSGGASVALATKFDRDFLKSSPPVYLTDDTDENTEAPPSRSGSLASLISTEHYVFSSNADVDNEIVTQNSDVNVDDGIVMEDSDLDETLPNNDDNPDYSEYHDEDDNDEGRTRMMESAGNDVSNDSEVLLTKVKGKAR